MKHNRLIFSVFAALSLVAPVAFAQDAAQSTSQTTAPTERAEQVSLEAFCRLSRAVEARSVPASAG